MPTTHPPSDPETVTFPVPKTGHPLRLVLDMSVFPHIAMHRMLRRAWGRAWRTFFPGVPVVSWDLSICPPRLSSPS